METNQLDLKRTKLKISELHKNYVKCIKLFNKYNKSFI